MIRNDMSSRNFDHFGSGTYASHMSRWLAPDQGGIAAANLTDPHSELSGR